MKTRLTSSAVMVLAILVAQAAASSQLVVPTASDLMIKTRRTIDRPGETVTTDIIYLKGARQRRELVVEGPPTYLTATWIEIAQCDERRMLSLYPPARTYAYEPIKPIEQPAARGMTLGPVVTVDTVDTGERRQFRRYVARHVITTRRIRPVMGDITRATVVRQDGWYIDAPSPACRNGDGNATHAYPIEETYRFSGEHGATAPTIQVQLVELSEAPLDDALFAAPEDYRPALPRPYGGYDMTQADTWMNRAESYRQVVVAWANHVRQYGFSGLFSGMRASARY